MRWLPRAASVAAVCRGLTWLCVLLLAVLSLLPAQDMVRTGLPGRFEHFLAYAGSAAIAVIGYGSRCGLARPIVGLWIYAAMLEYLQNFSPGRGVSIGDVAASALGALCGAIAAGLLWPRLSALLLRR